MRQEGQTLVRSPRGRQCCTRGGGTPSNRSGFWARPLQRNRCVGVKAARVVHKLQRKQMKNVLVAAMVALAAVYGSGCSVASGQGSVGDVVDDSTITTRVKSRFVEDKIVAANRIHVETLKGVVQLSGFAISDAERDRAAQISAAVPGVKQVQNAISVKPAG